MADVAPGLPEVRTDDPLSATTRREKRALLGIAALSIFLLWTDSLKDTADVRAVEHGALGTITLYSR